MSLQAAQEVYEWVCETGILPDNLGRAIFFLAILTAENYFDSFCECFTKKVTKRQ